MSPNQGYHGALREATFNKICLSEVSRIRLKFIGLLNTIALTGKQLRERGRTQKQHTKAYVVSIVS